MRPLHVWRALARPAAEPDHFSGKVSIQELNPTRDPKAIEILAVFFEPGARTVPHTHETEQLLHFVAGEGIVATEDRRRLFRAGDMVLIPAGAWHWHGATPSSEACHLSIRPAGGSSWPPDVALGDWEAYMDEVEGDR